MGIYLGKPVTDKETHEGENERLRFVSSSMQGWRLKNEDAHIAALDVDKDTHLFCVFDGHGGSEVSKFCEMKFRETLLQNENYQKGSYELALKETFLKIDQLIESPQGQLDIQAIINKDKNLDTSQLQSKTEYATSNAGCTANVLLIVGNTYYCANAGDARCILYRNTKEVVSLSEDHKPDGEIEYKRITKAGGYVLDGRVCENLNLTRAIGDLEYKKNADLTPEEQIITSNPDIVKKEFTAEDAFFVLGCDGIWEMLQADEITGFINGELKQENCDMKKMAENLLDKMIAQDTSEGVGCDNMSLIIVHLKNAKLVQG